VGHRIQEIRELHMGVMTVKCKHCGNLSLKEVEQRVVTCPKCGKDTVYFVQPRAG